MRSPLLYTLIFILIYSCSKPESFGDLTVQQNSLIPGLNVESSYLKDQLISFNMIDSEGNNITSNTSFTVDNQLINGNTISYDEIGSHDVSANYTIDSQNYSTDLIVFNIVEPINKVIVEDYTGTWCGYCPPVAHAIYELKEVYDNIISVGIHNNDELTIDQESDLRSELGISGFPSARLNRTISWFDPYQISDVNSLLSEENDCYGITLNIKGGGCAGFEYEWGTIDTPAELQKDDEVVKTSNGSAFVVGSHSLMFLIGTEVDYVKSLVGANFEIRNPNAQSSCGCGVSVNFDMDNLVPKF